MPAPERYESPQSQLFRLAVEARAEGLDFEEFWTRALRPGKSLVTRHWSDPPPECVVWPRDTFDRQNAMAAIHATREGWRRAYEGEEPSRPELALYTLGPGLFLTLDTSPPDAHRLVTA
jgi:hypothetical protein